MRIGKILVDSDTETHEARVIFAKFPYDIAERKVLLLYPIMNSGNKVCRAIRVVLDHKVPEDHVILINLFRSKLQIKPYGGSSKNYVDRVWTFSDHLPTSSGQKRPFSLVIIIYHVTYSGLLDDPRVHSTFLYGSNRTFDLFTAETKRTKFYFIKYVLWLRLKEKIIACLSVYPTLL